VKAFNRFLSKQKALSFQRRISMNSRLILFIALICFSAVSGWTHDALSTEKFYTKGSVFQKELPTQLARSPNQEELQKLLDSVRGRVTPEQMRRIQDVAKRSGVLEELVGVDFSTMVLSPKEKKRVILYANRIAQVAPPRKGQKTLPLSVLLQQLFSLARERSEKGEDPVMENRAVILSASLFSSGVDLSVVLGKDAVLAVRPRIQAKQVSLSGRHDLMRHFLTSAGLALTAGVEKAHKVGMEKELSDARGGSGFSFVDLTANRAGIQLAVSSTVFKEEALLIQARMSRIKKDTDIMPLTPGLPEGLSEREFTRRYKNTQSKSFRVISQTIDDRIDHCPVYWGGAIQN
jgi:hypothetical protein